MLFDTSGESQNIGVENNIIGVDSIVYEQVVGSFTNGNFTVVTVGLTCFVKSHYNHSSSEPVYDAGVGEECFFTFFQTDGIDDTFSLYTFQPGKNDRPFRRIYHNRNTANFGFRGNEIQERYHFVLCIEHGVVHIDVDDLCSIFHLFTGYTQSFIVFFL